ncbi:MAG: phosphoribosylanthranilate isomerase [Deltaproteobacteria bacterium]|nr:phosphoribosylanthranilate isomerase [Deltaproteobacteria bacterium]MBI3755737.1 phosphoribosylanthranilate isomerase [Deltaproteobacteria bacterium]
MCKVKICGITNLEDALAACEYGADALGFIFYKESPRFIEIEKVKEIIKDIPPFVTTVGVFVDEDANTINEIIKKIGLHMVQLHGNESPEFCENIQSKVIKTFRIKGARVMGIGTGEQGVNKEMERYNVSAYLLDTYREDVEGGSGITFNWGVAKDAIKVGKIILAGGLTVENVKQAVRIVMPYAVDVSSGVEESPGKKDLRKVMEFIETAKGAI